MLVWSTMCMLRAGGFVLGISTGDHDLGTTNRSYERRMDSHAPLCPSPQAMQRQSRAEKRLCVEQMREVTHKLIVHWTANTDDTSDTRLTIRQMMTCQRPTRLASLLTWGHRENRKHLRSPC
jgi:hypothetical protein